MIFFVLYFFFSLSLMEAEKCVWSIFYKMLLDGNLSTSHGTSFEEMRAFLMCSVVRVSLRE